MNVNYRVVALDPGGTTGYCQYDAEYEPDVGQPSRRLLEEKLTHMHFGPHEHHVELYAALEMAHIHNFYVVYESFEFRNMDPRHRDNINLMSREYIGVIKLFAQERGLRKNQLKAYTAGQSKGFIPDKAKNGLAANAKLKALPGFYVPSMKHANDAARVLANFLINVHGRQDLVRHWRNL